MEYRELNIKGNTKEDIETEIMLEVAMARSDKIELLKLILPNSSDELVDDIGKINSSVKKLLKKMKQDLRIQFFANRQSFSLNSTESQFLLNKYPHIFSNQDIEKNDNQFYYIKI